MKQQIGPDKKASGICEMVLLGSASQLRQGLGFGVPSVCDHVEASDRRGKKKEKSLK